jgi:hypothetical protein
MFLSLMALQVRLKATNSTSRARLTSAFADHIRLGRMKDINGALMPARNAIHALIADVDPTGLYLCKQPAQEDRLKCQSHTLGHMIRNLNEASLWPLPDAEDIVQTAQTFVLDFQRELWSNYTPLHENCTIERAVIAQTENAMERSRTHDSIPSEPVLRSMLATAKKFNAFEYHRMYLDANVNSNEVYDFAHNKDFSLDDKDLDSDDEDLDSDDEDLDSDSD